MYCLLLESVLYFLKINHLFLYFKSLLYVLLVMVYKFLGSNRRSTLKMDSVVYVSDPHDGFTIAVNH
jgi:hypothetical protein